MNKIFKLLCVIFLALASKAFASGLNVKMGVGGLLKEKDKIPSLYFSSRKGCEEELVHSGNEYKLVAFDVNNNVLSEREFNFKDQALNITGGPGIKAGPSRLESKVFLVCLNLPENFHKVSLYRSSKLVVEAVYSKPQNPSKSKR